MTWLAACLAIVLCVGVGLGLRRRLDRGADRAEARRLAALQPTAPARFEPEMVAGLPEPARRYFVHAILPGAPLLTVAEVEMAGRLALGTKERPRYIDMEADETLAAPRGFIWAMEGGRGLSRISGSDSGAWTRFWLAGLLPVARLGGTNDHARSAFGRMVAEAVFWTPAALLPGADVRWSAVDEVTARVSVEYGNLSQDVDLTVDAEGRATEVVFMRWSDANPEKRHRLQPFGGTLSQYRRFGGFRMPTHVEAGNHFGSDDYFPFFVIDVRDVRFPGADRAASLAVHQGVDLG